MIPKHKFKVGQRVEVKLVGRGGLPHRWAAGTLIDMHGRGASVRVDIGRIYQDFFHWSDIREPESVPESQPMATLGEISGRHRAPLRALPPYLDTEQPSAPKPEPRKEAVLVTHKDLRDMARMAKSDPEQQARKRQKRAHTTTQIGDLFKQHRLQKGLNQTDFAELIKSQPSKVSRIELGDRLPSDVELLEFCYAFALEIGELERIRKLAEGSEALAVPASGVSVKPAPPPPPPPPPPVPDTAAPCADAADSELRSARVLAPAEGEPYEDFIERLDGVVQIPRDKEKRTVWFAMARRFYELAKP